MLHAAARKLPILSEKPIADTWGDCLEIYDTVMGSGTPMQVRGAPSRWTSNSASVGSLANSA